MRFLASAALLAALVGVAPALAGTASSGPVATLKSANEAVLKQVRPEPMLKVYVPVSGIESQAQIASQLVQEGFTDITLSSRVPNMLNPQPQLTNPTKDLDKTPAHKGWNGTAYKDGKLYDVYVGE